MTIQDRPGRRTGLTNQQRYENAVNWASGIAAAKHGHRRRGGVHLTFGGVVGVALLAVIVVPLLVVAAWKALPYLAVVAAGVVWRRRPDLRARVYNTLAVYGSWRVRQAPAVRWAVTVFNAAVAGLAAWWLLWNLLWLALTAGVVAAAAHAPIRRRRPVVMHEPADVDDEPDRGPVVAAVAAGLGSRARTYLAAYDRLNLPTPTPERGDWGHTLTVRLPAGVVPGDLDTARFAGAYGVEAGRVRLIPGKPGHACIEVLDVDPADMQPGEWPHLGGPTDWTKPMTLGVDDTGRPVRLNLGGGRVLVVGQSGSGKTCLMRAIALYAATDPNVRLHVIDCKGGPAFRPFRGRVDYFHAGPADTAVGAHLAGVRAEVERRYRDEVTPERAGWMVVVIDEVQSLGKVDGANESLESIARLGREVGVGVVLGSQTPDKSSFHRPVADQCNIRVAMRLTLDWAVQMVLGQSEKCADLPRGHAFMSLDDGPALTRAVSCYVDDEQAAAHLARVPLVSKSDTPASPAPAPGTPAPEPERVSLADLLSAFRNDKAALGYDKGAPVLVVAERLGVTKQEVLDAMKRHGLKTAPYGSGGKQRGLVRAHVLKMQGENS